MVEYLLKSDGFKELTYVVEHDRFMRPVTFSAMDPAHTETLETTNRDAQPSTWDAMIKERDGVHSGASVEMFRLLEGGTQRIPCDREFETVQKECEKKADGQIEIQIRRGNGVNYVQKKGQPETPLGKLFEELTWKQILEKKLYIDGEDDPTAHL